MRKIICMMAGLALAALSNLASAAEDSGFYVASGLSALDLDFTDGTFRNSAGEMVPESGLGLGIDRAALLSITGGYNWGGWAFELTYEHSVSSADLSVRSNNSQGDYDYSNFRVAGVYRSPGTLYILGRFGIVMPNLDTDIPGSRLRMGNSGFLGLGGGYRLSPSWSVEVDATRSNDDTTTYTVGLRHRF